MNNKGKRDKKIETFPTLEDQIETRKWDTLFLEQLLRDADLYEEELEESVDLPEESVSKDLFDRIVNQLKDEGVWEEEDTDKEDMAKEDATNVYELLNEKERKALEIGLATLEEEQPEKDTKKKQHRRKIAKAVGTAAAIGLCVFAASMSSEANRKYVMGVVHSITKRGVNLQIDSSSDFGKFENEDEGTAYVEIEKNLGVKVPYLKYKPEEIRYLSYSVNKDKGVGVVFYQYQESILMLNMCKQDKPFPYNVSIDGNKIETVKTLVNEKEIDIWEMNQNQQSDQKAYGAQIEDVNTNCLITAKMELKEFTKIVRNLVY